MKTKSAVNVAVAVLVHLDSVAVFWGSARADPRPGLEHQKKIDDWKQTIRLRQIPDDHEWRVASLSSGSGIHVSSACSGVDFITESTVVGGRNLVRKRSR
jgi:hypothetical protein